MLQRTNIRCQSLDFTCFNLLDPTLEASSGRESGRVDKLGLDGGRRSVGDQFGDRGFGPPSLEVLYSFETTADKCAQEVIEEFAEMRRRSF